MTVFAEAAKRNDPLMTNLYFDVASVITEEITAGDAATVASIIRDVGPRRILYGSDTNAPGGSIQAGWEIFRTKIPLTAAEMQQIMSNETRFARR